MRTTGVESPDTLVLLTAPDTTRLFTANFGIWSVVRSLFWTISSVSFPFKVRFGMGKKR